MAPPTQDNRLIAVDTVDTVGKDKLLLASFSGQEQLSRLFSYQLEMLSTDFAIKPVDIVGKKIGFNVKQADGKTKRYFHGYVSRFSAGDVETGFRRYQAEVVPWLWFLTRTSDCRIFQDKTIPEVIEEVFKDCDLKDFDKAELKGNYEKWVYCVQYRETDFNFVSRLMEQEGIFYFFRHEEKKHTLVLADQKGAHKFCPEKEVEHEYTYTAQAVVDRLTSWGRRWEFTPGKWAQTDYNFEEHPARTSKTPAKLLLTEEPSKVPLPDNKKYEMFDFPAEYETKDMGKSDTKIRMEEDDAAYDQVSASSTCRTFACGGKFTAIKPPKDNQGTPLESHKGTFIISSIQHSATEPADYVSGEAGGGDYRNTFTCIPDSVTFRPPRLTPKPVIQGVQTAVVVGPQGEEIWPDKHGRVKVQFFWDRRGERNDKASCWIRVAQGSAGKSWGAMFIPRIGQEVVVSYEEGDPDWPLITGLVYNDDQTPHYKLPDEKTKSYIKTNTSKEGKGYNELRFEDKKDKEQIFIHAQRNMDTRVLNDSLARILHDRHQIIGNDKDGKKVGDQREMVYQDKHLNIKRDQVEHIEGNLQLTIGKGDAQSGGNLDIVVEKKKSELVEMDNDYHCKMARSEKVDMDQSLTVGMNQHEKVGMNHALEAGMAIHIKAGMTLVLEAGVQLSLKVGGNFIDINPAGISIVGTMVMINSGGAAGSGAGAKPKEPKDAKPAKPTKPDMADDSKTGQKSAPDSLS